MTEHFLDDDATLSCLFQPRYMSFELCVRLESISKIFLENARRYYRQLERFDFQDSSSKEDRVKWASKIYHCCPNLREIINLRVNKDSFDDDVMNFHFVSKMPSVSHVGVDFQHVSESVMLTLSDMKNLNSLELVSERISGDDSYFCKNRFRKLDVTSIKCDQLNFVTFCNPDRLTTLHLTDKGVILVQLLRTLKSYRHLRELSVEWTEPNGNDLLELIDFVAKSAHIETFSLSIDSGCCEDELANLANHAGFRKCLTSLKLDDIPEDVEESLVSSITKLSELRILHLVGMQGLQPDLFFQHLPNLERLEAVSYFHVDLMWIFPARFRFETSYVR